MASSELIVPIASLGRSRSRDHIEVRQTLATISAHPYAPMSSKRQKMTAKRGQVSEEPAQSYDHTKFVNEGAAEKFGLISKNWSFIKEKGFHHPEDFFSKIIANKGWRALCQPPKPTATIIV